MSLHLSQSASMLALTRHEQENSMLLRTYSLTSTNTLCSVQVRTVIQLAVVASICFVFAVIIDNVFSLPDAIHNHLPAHNPGAAITDITIKTCLRGVPFSKCQLDPKEWVRIEKDLYLGKGWSSRAYLHIKRKQEADLTPADKVILDVKVGRIDPAKGGGPKATAEWVSRPGGIWLLRSTKRHESDSHKAVTAVDVLFGPDATDPRTGWRMRDTPLLLDSPAKGLEAHLSIRTGNPPLPPKPVPRIRRDGKFKIMQASDLHLATGLGVCRDLHPDDPAAASGGTSSSTAPPCEADTRTLDFVSRLLDTEKPDLVILSGDQVNGDTAPDAASALLKLASLFITRSIPYAAIFGNHDDEKTSLTRTGSMSLLESLPYSLSTAGPADISGVGNYVLEVLAAGSSNQHHAALSLYLLDSHTYSPDEKRYHGYDWVKEDQISWFRATAQALRAKHARYTKIHMSLAFIHIPLPEYADRENVVKGGEWREGVTAPDFNSGFKDALVEEGVLVVGCGHDHVNDYCALSREKTGRVDEDGEKVFGKPELWMCYAGGAGFGGYAGYGGYHRRIRFWEVDTNSARIVTYKRVEFGETEKRVDELVVVDGGRLVV